MIKSLFTKIKELTTKVEVVTPPPVIDTNNIYHRFGALMQQIGTIEIDLSNSRVGIGNINSYAPTLATFITSLMEANHALANNEYVTKETFTLREKIYVSFDSFLFVEDGFYVQNVNQRLMTVFDHIEKYYQYMKDADKQTYGAMEHNHRKLYSYTETVIEFIESLIYHFGSQTNQNSF